MWYILSHWSSETLTLHYISGSELDFKVWSQVTGDLTYGFTARIQGSETSGTVTRGTFKTLGGYHVRENTDAGTTHILGIGFPSRMEWSLNRKCKSRLNRCSIKEKKGDAALRIGLLGSFTHFELIISTNCFWYKVRYPPFSKENNVRWEPIPDCFSRWSYTGSSGNKGDSPEKMRSRSCWRSLRRPWSS
jgi:hypothetical protein